MMDKAERSLRDSTYQLFARYEAVLDGVSEDTLSKDDRLSIGNLLWICHEGRTSGDQLPLDKISRWLGFVQGCLAMRGLCDVDEERDFTRPMFREGYDLMGVNPGVRERSK